jgi:hypothetical protein
MDYRFLGIAFLLFVCPAIVLFAIHSLIVFLSKMFSWHKLHCMSEMGYQNTGFENAYYWFFAILRTSVAVIGVILFLMVGASFIDASAYVKHNAENVQYYEQLEHPKIEDITKLVKYNKNHKIATLLAKKEVAEKLVLIDETKVLQKMVEDLKNEKD